MDPNWSICSKFLGKISKTLILALKADGLIEAGDQNQIQHFAVTAGVAHVAPPIPQQPQQQVAQQQQQQQQQFPIQIQNSTETVIMEVMPG